MPEQWKKDREEFWGNFDLFADTHEPVVKPAYMTYRIQLPKEVSTHFKTVTYTPYIIYLDVDRLGCASLNERTYWFGNHAGHMSHLHKQEIYDFLIEWELIEWRRIGPEDSELFATEKLLKEGVENES